jgi:hypothetical protein
VLPKEFQEILDIPCVFQEIFGFKCIGCGLKTALIEVMYGNFYNALKINKFSIIVFGIISYLSLNTAMNIKGKIYG